MTGKVLDKISIECQAPFQRLKTVSEQGVHSGMQHHQREDDLFLETDFIIKETSERRWWKQEVCQKE